MTYKEIQEKVSKYINSLNEPEKSVLKSIRSYIKSEFPDLKESWKWNAPNYEYDGLCMWLVAFQRHISINFYKGVLIDDFHNLYDSKGNNRKNNRIIKIDFTDQFDTKLLKPYIKKSIEVNMNNIQLPLIEMEMPEVMVDLFKSNLVCKGKFKKLVPSHQRKWIESIGEAKKEETKLRRLHKLKLLLEKK